MREDGSSLSNSMAPLSGRLRGEQQDLIPAKSVCHWGERDPVTMDGVNLW